MGTGKLKNKKKDNLHDCLIKEVYLFKEDKLRVGFEPTSFLAYLFIWFDGTNVIEVYNRWPIPASTDTRLSTAELPKHNKRELV